ncbi:hypothetical protein LCGC14_2709490, partial [marine sediment metagenome]
MDSDDRFATTEYFIEATPFEQEALLLRNENLKKYKITQDNMGIVKTIGYLDKRPVCVSFDWTKINACRICFYYSESEVVDWKMIDDSLSKTFSVYREGRRTNVRNFGHVLEYIRQKYG